ncbi:glycosyltransferase family 9 protein [Anaerospora hongkongensis]|uniref:glycosyltransferase family 9 protein n=1 Tax=Anaerospora hongkongensis TaxID=244830 RepID=UPI00289EAD40|nr:glycosyltransferase family 9 protein [Anaerospora hongkongensis]
MLDNIERILIIRRGAIGDIVFTLPAYYMLRSNFPNSKISFLVKDNYSPVLRGFPGLDETLLISNKILASGNVFTIGKMSIDLLHTMKTNNYQLVVDFAGHGEQAFFLWLSGIKHRWGLIKAKKPIRQRFYTNSFIRQQNVHVIDQHLALLKQGGLTSPTVKNDYIVPQDHLDRAKALFANWGLTCQKPTIFIQPFTGDGIPGKIWPLERYIKLAEHWERQGVQILFGGGPSERQNLTEVAARFPVAAGEADFVTSIGLSTLSSIVVGGDTGLLHAALAAGKRTVMVVGPTNYQLIGPYRKPEWTVRPHSGISIETITVEQLIAATQTALNETFG